MTRDVICAIAIVLGLNLAGLVLSCSSVPTRATVERDEDNFCRAVSRARELEKEYGVLPRDAGAE